MSKKTLIHMERPDPGVFSQRQFWRAWIKKEPGRESFIVIEEGTVGGTFKCIELPKDESGLTVTEKLETLIDAKLAEGWGTRMSSTESRDDNAHGDLRLFQFKGHTPDGQRAVVQKILKVLDSVVTDSIDWIDHKSIQAMIDDTATQRWDGEIQVGLDRLRLSVGARSKVVLSARVPAQSVAARFLTVLAASNHGLNVVITDDAGRLVEPKGEFASFGVMDEWLEEVASELHVVTNLLRLGPITSATGNNVVPIIF